MRQLSIIFVSPAAAAVGRGGPSCGGRDCAALLRARPCTVTVAVQKNHDAAIGKRVKPELILLYLGT
jgi:hypothetical protein